MSLAFKPNFYVKPKSLEEALEILSKYQDRAKIIAGGTGIYEVSHRGLLSETEALVDIGAIGLSYVRTEEAVLKIGACTTMSTLLASKQVGEDPRLAALADALRAIQPLQVKNVATVGGAICTALPFFDLPVALFCLAANVTIAPSGRREEIGKFVQGYFSVNLGPSELVREVELPLQEEKGGNGKSASAFEKFALTGDDWAIVNAGAHVTIEDGAISKSVVSVGGGVGEKPVIAAKSSKSIIGAKINNEQGIKDVLDKSVPLDIETVSDIRASAEYRLRVAKVVVRRAVLAACRRANI
ncbi:MAG TPA: FAD binding domain-containing protein [Nitrososphaerales archaeon]|nr:FAD binding domain-containing protein [Nitrososphaerales archaeon]